MQTFDRQKKKSIAQFPRATKPQTTSKKNTKLQNRTDIGQDYLSRDAAKLVKPQTTKHSTTSFKFVGPLMASRGSLHLKAPSLNQNY